MHIDKFTKIVLTIIAINLSILSLSKIDFITSVHASSDQDQMDMPLETSYGLVPVNEDGSIDVNIINSEILKVSIREIKDPHSRGDWDRIDVSCD